MSLAKTAPQVRNFLDNLCFKAKNGSENSDFLLEKKKILLKKQYLGV